MRYLSLAAHYMNSLIRNFYLLIFNLKKNYLWHLSNDAIPFLNFPRTFHLFTSHLFRRKWLRKNMISSNLSWKRNWKKSPSRSWHLEKEFSLRMNRQQPSASVLRTSTLRIPRTTAELTDNFFSPALRYNFYLFIQLFPILLFRKKYDFV